MTKICPKCSHVRQPTEEAPDWQCPACGVAYAKVAAAGLNPEHPTAGAMRYATAIETPGSGFLWLKLILFALLLYVGWTVAKMDRHKVRRTSR